MQQQTSFRVAKDVLKTRQAWFWIGLVGLFIGSAVFRFWGLARFNVLVYDEFYFAKFANYYLTSTPFLDGHPPLGKYLIALGIWLSQFNPFGYSVRTTVPEFGFDLPTVSYRWMNALVGSGIPVLVALLAYQLSHRYRYALIAGLLTALDGLLLVESRYALINIYLLTFGLLGQIFFLVALSRPEKAQRNRWLLAAGIGFGASMSVKWTGLGFLLGLYVLWGIVQGANARSRQLLLSQQPSSPSTGSGSATLPAASLPYIKAVSPSSPQPKTEAMMGSVLVSHPLRQLGRLHWRDLLFYLGVIPGFVYSLIWLPHIHHDPRHSLLGYQKQLYTWHTSISGQAHSYCAPWYNWPWLGRSRPYYIDQIDLTTGTDAGKIMYQYVSGMGNPFLWWQSAIAIVLVAGVALWTLPKILARGTAQAQSFDALGWTTGGTALYILLSYLANLLPWAAISRCSIITTICLRPCSVF
ncbi:MAG: phospholipid carrier-dependent glycosyltransferase [Leptolyngbyaceae cyanobacterium SL_1_1]|nr:phospholipid carrier-dependent glycosyltransferase [Leptolyngbyaceae cyanobacterium SL_1_1]